MRSSRTGMRPSRSHDTLAKCAMKHLIVITAVSAALSLSACVTVGPDYNQPELPMPASYDEAPSADSIQGAWWTLFGEPTLDSLVVEALAGNQDLAIAAARVEEARALAGIARADQWPEVNATADVARTRQSDMFLPPVGEAENNFFSGAGTLSFELDFWGRLRRTTEAARAELLATEEAQRIVALALVSEVALAYFDLVALDLQLAIAQETLSSRSEAVVLQVSRLDAGTISELDLTQARADLAAAEAATPVLERLVRQTEDRMAVLLGRIGGTVERGASLDVVGAPEVPVGLPSELLTRRPDVLAAEQALVAANARIGAARAAYFPSVALTGYAGYESEALSDLVTPGAGIWQAAVSVFQPIFNAGRTRRQVDAARARERQALAAYTKTVQVAFAEVEDALVARRTSVAEREALMRRVETLTLARSLAQVRYEAGESSYLDVLDADRNLFQAELDLTDVRRSELAAAVTLFKALGGGWTDDTLL